MNPALRLVVAWMMGVVAALGAVSLAAWRGQLWFNNGSAVSRAALPSPAVPRSLAVLPSPAVLPPKEAPAGVFRAARVKEIRERGDFACHRRLKDGGWPRLGDIKDIFGGGVPEP